MKQSIDGIIVVEGKEDASLISSLINCEIVTLNGCELKNINYLKIASKNNNIYLLTDPDDAGEIIRTKINKIIPNIINIKINISDCNRGIKNGVAECDISTLLEKLEPYFIDEKNIKTENNKLRYFNKKEREIICKKIGIENCNFKTFCTRINRLKIAFEKIEKMVFNEYGN